jgi:hypothetical protein
LTWLIIGIVLLAAFGPIFWLMPSRRDRRLAAMRLTARQEGLSVDIRHIPKTNPTAQDRVSSGGVIRDPVVECAAYALTFAQPLNRLPVWRLLKAQGAADGPRPNWLFDPVPDTSNPHWARLWTCFETLFENLPDDVIGLEMEPRLTTVFWLETPTSGPTQVSEIAGQLRALEGRLVDLEVTIEAEIADEDS